MTPSVLVRWTIVPLLCGTAVLLPTGCENKRAEPRSPHKDVAPDFNDAVGEASFRIAPVPIRLGNEASDDHVVIDIGFYVQGSGVSAALAKKLTLEAESESFRSVIKLYLQEQAFEYVQSAAAPPHVDISACLPPLREIANPEIYRPGPKGCEYSPESLEWRTKDREVLNILPSRPSPAIHWYPLSVAGYRQWWKSADAQFHISDRFSGGKF